MEGNLYWKYKNGVTYLVLKLRELLTRGVLNCSDHSVDIIHPSASATCDLSSLTLPKAYFHRCLLY